MKYFQGQFITQGNKMSCSFTGVSFLSLNLIYQTCFLVTFDPFQAPSPLTLLSQSGLEWSLEDSIVQLLATERNTQKKELIC